METLMEQSFGVCLTIVSFLGLYPPEKPTCWYKIRGYFLYFVFVIVVPVLALTYLFKDGQHEQLNYNAAFLAETLCFSTKLLPFIVRGDEIRKCVNSFEDSYLAALGKDQQCIVDHCMKTCKIISAVFVVNVTICCLGWAFRPIFFGNDNMFPLDIWLPFSTTAHRTIFWSVYILVSLAVLYAGWTGGLIDPLIGGLAYHATGQLRVLKYNLKHMSEFDKSHSKPETVYKIMYTKIQDCIKHHHKILVFVKNYEECFSSVVFSQFAGSAFATCFCFLQIIKNGIFNIDGLTNILSISISLVQLFFYCYFGSLLFEENNNLTDAIYLGSWYEYDVKSKKALITLMERSKRPMIVTSGKIIELNLETFTTILKRCYSLLAILKNYQ